MQKFPVFKQIVKCTRGINILLLIAALVGQYFFFSTEIIFAAPPPGTTTTPYTVSYSAKLADAGGVPITTTQQIRFSLWSDADVDATDFLPGGGINPAAGGYSGWQETHTVTPDANGLFHVQLGSITTLPNFTIPTHIFLQVDVKPNGTPDTSYETLDPDGNTANVTDRHPVNSTAFAINSDTVDNRDAGLAAGEIPYLDGAALLPLSTIPGGTNADTFIIDVDDTIAAPGSIVLQFGSALARYLEYDLGAAYFNFNDDVNITGDLSVTGDTGIGNDLTVGNDLDVTGDTTLTGDLTASGVVNFASSDEFHMREVADEAAATCTTVDELVLDTTENTIYVCTGVGAPGTWAALTGGGGGAPYSQTLSFEPEYNDSVIESDGTNNRGKLSVEFNDTDGTPGNNNYNFYIWTTRQGAAQDLDLVIRTVLPTGFSGWEATPINFTYKTLDGNLANNKLDISIEDTNGNPVSLTGGTNLVNAAWTTSNITYLGVPTWSAGQPITIHVKMTANSSGTAYAGKLSLNYTGL